MLSLFNPYWDREYSSLRDTLARLDEMGREMDRLFGDFRRDWGFGNLSPFNLLSGASMASAGIQDLGDAFLIHADVPGLSDKDVEISATHGSVSVRASRPANVPEGYTVHRQERGAYELSQSFALPTRIDPDKATATVKNGVLELKLPKAPDAQPRKISVKG